MSTIIIALLSALIGTYFGTYFLSRRQEAKMKKVRTIAIRAIKIIRNYSKSNGTYEKATDEFNTKLNISEKRTIAVALHKLGVPILPPGSGGLDVKNIQFAPAVIDRDLLDDILLQIEHGQCDHLFFEDPDKYFSENQRTYALRNLAKKFVDEILTNSTYHPEKEQILYPSKWKDYSWGEMKAIAVFKYQVTNNIYFGEDGKAVSSKMTSLKNEIDAGIWDIYLNWSFEAYTNLLSTTNLNENFVKISQNALAGQSGTGTVIRDGSPSHNTAKD